MKRSLYLNLPSTSQRQYFFSCLLWLSLMCLARSTSYVADLYLYVCLLHVVQDVMLCRSSQSFEGLYLHLYGQAGIGLLKPEGEGI
jgi:hypothetical protein